MQYFIPMCLVCMCLHHTISLFAITQQQRQKLFLHCCSFFCSIFPFFFINHLLVLYQAHLHMNIMHDEMLHPCKRVATASHTLLDIDIKVVAMIYHTIPYHCLQLCYAMSPDEFNDIDSHCRIQQLRPFEHS